MNDIGWTDAELRKSAEKSNEVNNAYKRGYEQAKKEFERPQGEWIPVKRWDNTHDWVCSECGKKNEHGITIEKFCYKCGADMRGGAE